MSAVALEIGLGVALFTAIMLILVLVILIARCRLVETGTVPVMVNGERELRMPVGIKLMYGLAVLSYSWHPPVAVAALAASAGCRS